MNACSVYRSLMVTALLSGMMPIDSYASDFPELDDVSGEEVSSYELWRRLKFDFCQELPTADEIRQIADNAGEIPWVDMRGTIEDCAQSESFAEMIALELNMFTMPYYGATSRLRQLHAYVDADNDGDYSSGYEWLRVHFTGLDEELYTTANAAYSNANSDVGLSTGYTTRLRYFYNHTFSTATWSNSDPTTSGCVDWAGMTTTYDGAETDLETAMLARQGTSSYYYVTDEELQQRFEKVYFPYFVNESTFTRKGDRSYVNNGVYVDDDGYFIYVCRVDYEQAWSETTCGDSDDDSETGAVLCELNDDGDYVKSEDQTPSMERDPATQYICNDENSSGADAEAGDVVELCTNFEGDGASGASLNCKYNGQGLMGCGCGEGLSRCIMTTPMSDHGDVEDDMAAESFQTVKKIVHDGEPFTDVVNSNCRQRTARLQHFYDTEQARWDYGYRDTMASPNCNRLVDWGASGELSTLVSEAECDEEDLAESLYVNADGSEITEYLTFEDNADDGVTWETVCVDEEGRLGDTIVGVLNTYDFLKSAPTGPNAANRWYSYFLCEDISERWTSSVGGWDLDDDNNYSLFGDYDYETETCMAMTMGWMDADDTSPSALTIDFHPIRGADVANEALDPDLLTEKAACKGCHVVLNPLAALRNDFYPNHALYDPLHEEMAGAFLGEALHTMRDLGDTMASSGAVHACMVQRAAYNLLGFYLDPDDEELHELVEYFTDTDDGNFDMRKLYLKMAQTQAYRKSR